MLVFPSFGDAERGVFDALVANVEGEVGDVSDGGLEVVDEVGHPEGKVDTLVVRMLRIGVDRSSDDGSSEGGNFVDVERRHNIFRDSSDCR